jgi:hypothetical protein
MTPQRWFLLCRLVAGVQEIFQGLIDGKMVVQRMIVRKLIIGRIVVKGTCHEIFDPLFFSSIKPT